MQLFVKRMYGGIEETEVYELYNRGNIVHFVKTWRIEWLGHEDRMDSSRMPYKALFSTMFDKRRKGRKRKRWRCRAIFFNILLC